MSCTPYTSCGNNDDCDKFGGGSSSGESWAGKTCFSKILCTVVWQDDEDAIVLTETATATAASPTSSTIASTTNTMDTRNTTSTTLVVNMEDFMLDTQTESPVQEDDFIMINNIDGIVGVGNVRTATKSNKDDDDDEFHEVAIGSPKEHYSNKRDRLLRGYRGV